MAISFLRLALGAARLFVLPFHQLSPLSAALGERRLSWSSDDSLLSVRSRQQDVEKGPQLRSRSAQSLNVLGTRCSRDATGYGFSLAGYPALRVLLGDLFEHPEQSRIERNRDTSSVSLLRSY